jgi:hypothetical protein
MKAALLVGVVVAGLVALDRLLLWAEARGWIYWRRKKRVGGQVGASIAAELGAILSPAERIRQEAAAVEERLPDASRTGGSPPLV